MVAGKSQNETENRQRKVKIQISSISRSNCLKHHRLFLPAQLFLAQWGCVLSTSKISYSSSYFVLHFLPNRSLSSFFCLPSLSTSHLLKHAGIYTQAPMPLSFTQAFTGPIAAWHCVSQFSAYYSHRDLLSYGTQWARERESQASEWIS